MRAEQRKSLSFGDIVAAAYDAADRKTKNSRKKQVLAARAVRSFLAKAGRLDLARRLSDS